jgi:hypothetical protein
MSGESGAKSVEYDGAKCTDSDQSVAFDDGDVNVDGNSSDEESSTCVVSARRSHSSVPVSDHSRGGLSFSISRLLSDRASGCKDVDVGSDDRENSDEDMEEDEEEEDDENSVRARGDDELTDKKFADKYDEVGPCASV